MTAVGQVIITLDSSRGPSSLQYLDIKGQAGRLGEHRPIADYEACLRTCVDIIKKQVSLRLHQWLKALPTY